MTTELTAHNVQITTMTALVKVLTVSGRQVTLTMFRQMVEEPLIDDDGSLRGTPWHWVNVHPDKSCDDMGAHWHVIWAPDAHTLRRATVNMFDREDVALLPASGTALMDALVRDQYLRDLTLPDPPSMHLIKLGERYGIRLVARASKIVARLAILGEDLRQRTVQHRLNGRRDDRTYYGVDGASLFVSQSAQCRAIYHEADQLVEQLGTQFTDVLKVEVDNQTQQEVARRERHAAVRLGIGALEQLYVGG